MSDDKNDEFLDSITPDVMKCLDRARFFDKLDDLLCPRQSEKAPQSCSGNFELSISVLRASGFDESDLDDIFAVLRSRGGFCDCEILYNVSETNRLKVRHWQEQANQLGESKKHQHS